MADISGKQFFERAVTIHRHDCEAASTAEAAARIGNDEVGETIGVGGGLDEAIGGYAVATRPVYDGLRRLIGQLAGLLVLAQAGGRRDVLDLPDIAAARDQWSELGQRLGGVRTPQGLAPHFTRLEAAFATLGEVLDDFGLARLRPDWETHLDRAGERIKHAYAYLQAASEPRAGMMPVDFNHACCSCAQRWRQEGGEAHGAIFDLGA